MIALCPWRLPGDACYWGLEPAPGVRGQTCSGCQRELGPLAAGAGGARCWAGVHAAKPITLMSSWGGSGAYLRGAVWGQGLAVGWAVAVSQWLHPQALATGTLLRQGSRRSWVWGSVWVCGAEPGWMLARGVWPPAWLRGRENGVAGVPASPGLVNSMSRLPCLLPGPSLAPATVPSTNSRFFVPGSARKALASPANAAVTVPGAGQRRVGAERWPGARGALAREVPGVQPRLPLQHGRCGGCSAL